MIFGAHESVAGGLHRAIALAGEDRCEAIQVFTKVSGQWREPALSAEQIAAFRAARAAWAGAGRTLAHASYLINLCADDASILDRSREALFLELARCDALGIDFVVFHPGAHRGLGEEAGLDRIGESLAMVLARAKGLRATLCIENTAGQGTTLGDRIDRIAAMIERAGPERARLGVCIDTQHAFAAGHDLRSEAGYERFWADFDRQLGMDRLRCMHVNDSKAALGQRLDRHERIGDGEMGLAPFWRLANDPRLADVPAVIELPPLSKERRGYAEEIDRLRRLRGAAEPAAAPRALEAPRTPKRRPRIARG
ncbi:endonuclease IV [Sorangium cellulosum]|uniref:Probable endonuclease 4 n=1 Tax=Sorangium cellulosum TaxID=56 RepID=A0A4P2QAG5_SORCE|nr:deoxyribonuclease IV [Sorangium cellulosum]AUX26654.1 endonuclease IV [Sorangium cellulosum]